MSKGSRHTILFIFFLIAFSSLMAQVRVQSSVDRDRILIGEQLQLLIEAYVPLGQPVVWPRFDTIPHFDVLQTGIVDTTQSIEGNKFSQVFTLTSFDSGRWQLPQIQFTVNGQGYYTDTLSIDVSYKSFDPSEDYHDIKEIEIVVHPYARYIPWIVLGIGLLSMSALGFLLSIRKKQEEVKPPPPPIPPRVSPYDEAIRKLKELKEQKLEETGQVKEYYTSLNDILREFLDRRLNLTTFDKTNTEVVEKLRERNMPRETFQKLRNALQISDYVKFAKQKPTDEDNKENFRVIENAIELLNRSF